MGLSTEVFFPTKGLPSMSEEGYAEQQKKNIEMGNRVGVRNYSIVEDEDREDELSKI